MKVLVVEDDPDIQDLVVTLLSRDGHTVVAEDEGLSGLAAALSQSPDLVVLDAADLAPVASVRLPRRVPAGFHGTWLPDAGAR